MLKGSDLIVVHGEDLLAFVEALFGGHPDLHSPQSSIRNEMLRFEGLLDQTRFTNVEKKIIIDGVRFAAQVHLHQRDRSDGFPFFRHVLAVAANVLQHFPDASSDTVIAALLHDSVEDRRSQMVQLLGGQSEDISDAELRLLLEKRYGVKVADTVFNLTNTHNYDPKSEEFNIEKYVEYVSAALLCDKETRTVKLCDIADNALKLENVLEENRFHQLKEKYTPILSLILEYVRDGKLTVSVDIPEELFRRVQAQYHLFTDSKN